jgi:hypothetical protein
MASAAGTRTLLACGIVGVCAALVVLRAGPASAQRGGSGGSGKADRSVTVPSEVRELWREYPLNPTTPPAAPSQPSVRRQSTEPTSSPEPGSSAADREFESIPFALAAAIGVAAIALVALALFLLRPVWATDFRIGKQLHIGTRQRRRRTTRDDERLFETTPTTRPSTPDDGPGPEVEPLPSESKDDKLELDSADARERSDAVKIARSATPGQGEQHQGEQHESYAEVGEQVASVLAAAQRAAEEIRATTLEEAERIRQEAVADAASTRDEAAKAAEQTRRESEALRAEAEEYSKEARDAADRYVATTRQQVEDEAAARRAESEREAAEMHRAAEQRARDVETEALHRRQAIIAEAERSEARLEQLLGVYRGMTSQLEELLASEQARTDAADEAPADELGDDLHPRGSREQSASQSGASS